MSTNSNCELLEITPGQWFYVLEDGGAPKNAWDWREYAQAYGPFPTSEEAHKHLRDNHANPGGHYKVPYVDGFTTDGDEVLQKLITEATSPNQGWSW